MASWGLKEFSQDEYYFRLYDNVGKKNHFTIMKETGCCDIINLAYFDMNSKNLNHESAIMIGGVWGFKPVYHEYGVCIDKGGKMTIQTEQEATYDYAVGLPVITYNGMSCVKSLSTTDANGVTYVGMKANGNVVLYLSTKDRKQTTTQAVNVMKDAGCVHILRFDGSWSSAGHLGVDVTPSQYRIVRSHLLVFKRPQVGGNGGGGGTPIPPTNNSGGNTNVSNFEIIKRMATNNQCYKYNSKCTKKEMMIHSTAAPGEMFGSIYNIFNNPKKEAGVEYVIDDTGCYQILPDGIEAWHAANKNTNRTYMSVEICEHIETCMIPINWGDGLFRGNPYNRSYAVKRLQQELLVLGYDPKGVDGSFGPGCEAALKAYQKSVGLAMDGICGKKTLNMMAKRSGSYMAYNPALAAEYFNTVYRYAVLLTAHCLKVSGGSPDKILCHCEGAAKGIASNHADVMHWFPYHNKTMDIFRADVKLCMAGGTPIEPTKPPVEPSKPVEPPKPTVDPEYIAAVDALLLKGFVNTEVANLWKAGTGFTSDVVEAILKTAASRFQIDRNTAVDMLVANKVITDGAYWKGDTHSDANVQALIKKLSKAI